MLLGTYIDPVESCRLPLPADDFVFSIALAIEVFL